MSRLADRAKSYPLASFGAALLPPELGGPLPAQFVQRVDRYVTRLPATSRFAVRAGLASLAAASYLTTGRALPRLHPDERARVLHRIAALSPEVAAAVEGLKAIVLLANGADTYAHELLARAQEHDAARPDAELTVILSADSPSVTRADAVVVGSGAGGAMVARTLARAGLDVVVLEEGRRWTVEEFRSTHPVDRYAGLYRGAGATVALGRPAVVLPMGRAVGGTTVVNSGTCFRPSLAVQRRWRDEFGLGLADPDQLGRRLDDAEQTLRVAPVPLEIMGRNGRLLLQAAKSLGWRAAPIPRNAPGCRGCCQCAIGCPSNAKFGVHLNALPQACAAGARIISWARVERILHRAGRAYGVRARRPDGTTLDVLADAVVVAAAMVADRGVGTVRSVRGETVVRYDIAPGEIAKLRVALQAIGRLLFAAGAVEVLTGIPGAPPMRSLPELQDVLRRANPRSLHLAAFHPTGTAAAGADEQLCPVDATGRLRGVEGVWVADASILPSCPEVNPQLSIMAMALAVADQTVAKVVGVR